MNYKDIVNQDIIADGIISAHPISIAIWKNINYGFTQIGAKWDIIHYNVKCILMKK